MSVNFANVLNSMPAPGEAERPKPFPNGSYVSVVRKHEFGESSKKKTPFVEFEVGFVAPGADVDQEELAAVNNWQKRSMRLTFYLTQDAMWRLQEFCDHCGVTYTGRTWPEVIPELTGQQFTSVVEQTINTDKPNDPPYSNIVQTAAA